MAWLDATIVDPGSLRVGPLAMDTELNNWLRDRVVAPNVEACFVANPGNAGDGLIADATYRYFDNIAEHSWPAFEVGNPSIVNYPLMIYGGGGNLSELYTDAISQIELMASLGKEIVVLPHTVSGYGGRLASIADRVTIFCREHVSFEYLKKEGFPEEKLFLSEDMALKAPPELPNSCLLDGLSGGVRICLRTDRESALNFSVPASIDISRSWEGKFWSRKFLSQSVSRSVYDYLYGADLVVSDRLHVIIASSVLGNNTIMLKNSYFKNLAMHSHSLVDRFPKTQLMSESSVLELFRELRIQVRES